jgi:hypothetical protein
MYQNPVCPQCAYSDSLFRYGFANIGRMAARPFALASSHHLIRILGASGGASRAVSFIRSASSL